MTAATQWLERTLDDSANKRIAVPEAFLAVDAILNIYTNVVSGLVVHEKVIARHIQEELPFMASENVMMVAVKRGGDRQEIHEKIRQLSQEAGHTVKELGQPNDLVERMAAEPMLGLSREEIEAHLDPKLYVGRCPQQVEEFLDGAIQPVLDRHAAALERADAPLEV